MQQGMMQSAVLLLLMGPGCRLASCQDSLVRNGAKAKLSCKATQQKQQMQPPKSG
jgi:hypothetical protein